MFRVMNGRGDGLWNRIALATTRTHKTAARGLMNVASSTTARACLRSIVEAFVWLLLAGLLLETWLLAGIAVSCRVVGDSMAESLLGAHREVACADCGFRFSCGVDPRSTRSKAVCPNCGYPDNDLLSPPVLDGQRLLIDRTTFSLQSPRRWEVAALRHPQRADNILVKRVVGLPGEFVEIRNGDAFADGQIQRKNLAQQHAMAILVHDADCRPTLEPMARPRWRAEGRKSRWETAGTGFSHPADAENRSVEWLAYHHARRAADGKTVEGPITDVCGYNQWQPRRDEDVHAVPDLLLQFRLSVGDRSQGDLYVRATDGGNVFEIRLQFKEENRGSMPYQLLRDGKPIPEVGGQLPFPKDGRRIEVSLIDRQFLFAVDGRTVAAWPYERHGAPPAPATPLAIGVSGLAATIREIRVYRDVYYTRPVGSRAGGVRLGADEYSVLGDNSPISDDSRDWTERGAVGAKLFVGKPLAAIPSLDLTLWWGWHFQVPNLRRIQYIQ
jgi:signal peptidase I